MGYAMMTVFGIVLIALSRIPVRFILRGMKPILFIVALTFVINLFTMTGGKVYFEWKFIHVTSDGIRTAFYMAYRLVIIVALSQLLTLTTSPLALTDGLEHLMTPLRIVRFPVHEVAMMMTIALRFIPTLIGETDRIMKAQMSRGADFESGNLVRRARNMVPLLVPLFVSAFRRADELALAMESRCYRGGAGRTRMKVLRMAPRDGVAGFVLLLVLLSALADRLGWLSL
jgi:energy-coupling factor transport system permease protein